MSGWNWALMALSGQCGTEMSLAGMDLAANLESKETSKEESVLELPLKVYQDDAGPVLKAYYDAQPG